jgi:hypothetical protein
MFKIARVPSIASSSRTVSVACSGKKLRLYDFGISFIDIPRISWIPRSGEPKTTKT